MTASMRECISMASTFVPLGHMIKMPSILYSLGQTAFCGCSWFNRSLAQVSILESSTFGSNEPSNSPLAYCRGSRIIRSSIVSSEAAIGLPSTEPLVRGLVSLTW
jgi:hypothetical protein